MPSKAKFNTNTKEAIFERDGWCCILCGANSNLWAHHVFFWLEANRWRDRNAADQWVTICGKEHDEIHAWDKEKRQRAIDYLID